VQTLPDPRQFGSSLDGSTGSKLKASRALFDYLVGAAEQRRRHREADCLGGLEVDDHLEFGKEAAPVGQPDWLPSLCDLYPSHVAADGS
jgi:hypothetical protein